MTYKKWLFLALACVLLAVLALPVQALAAQPGLLIIGNSYTLESGETLDEDLAVVGGNVLIEDGATVDGNIFILGGTLHVAGDVSGSITATGGVVELAETALVEGDVSTAGASFSQEEGAQVEGDVIETSELRNRTSYWRGPMMVNDVLSPLAFLARSLVVAALAVLAAMFFPKPVERVAKTITSQPLLSGGMGLLTVLVFPLALVLLVITIIGIPLALLALLALACLYLYGWIALGYEVGRRAAEMFHWDWAPPVSAGVGTLVISLVFAGVGSIACLGWLIVFVAWHVALGAVLLTRFGTQDYMGGFSLSGTTPLPPAVPPSEPPSSISPSPEHPVHPPVPPPPSEGYKVVDEGPTDTV